MKARLRKKIDIMGRYSNQVNDAKGKYNEFIVKINADLNNQISKITNALSCNRATETSRIYSNTADTLQEIVDMCSAFNNNCSSMLSDISSKSIELDREEEEQLRSSMNIDESTNNDNNDN